ncbi:hypothetical protein PQX77_007182 [Marasmius sp. AFHP31]|nr:hypothetical protein PQX77_007182 [Marasmius sp. AFHP31]
MEEKDIPHCTSLQKMVTKEWVWIMHQLKRQFQVALGDVSFTTDGWTDSTVFPFIAVTAHWVELAESKALPPADPSQPPVPQLPTVLCLRVAMIRFYGLPVAHTGEHLAKAFYNILERLGLVRKVGHITVDNTSNNGTMMKELEVLFLKKRIPFNAKHRCVRCWPHILHLANTAVIEAANSVQLALAYTENNWEIEEFTLPNLGLQGSVIFCLAGRIQSFGVTPL